ncbi:MAG: response regulator [Gemmatimonadales bacterium]
MKLLLADDHHLVVQGLKSLLQPKHEVVGVAHTGPDTLELVSRQQADCLLLDMSMPEGNGLDLIAPIKARQPGLKVIIVTMYVDQALAEAAMQRGADGFVPKDAGIEVLESALAEVMAGRHYVARDALKRRALTPEEQGLGLEQLSPRQRQIVLLLGEGKSNAEISQATDLDEKTITFHRTNIRRALGIPNEAGLVRWATLVVLGRSSKRSQ